MKRLLQNQIEDVEINIFTQYIHYSNTHININNIKLEIMALAVKNNVDGSVPAKKANLSEIAAQKGNATGLKNIYIGIEWTGDSGDVDLDVMACFCNREGYGVTGCISKDLVYFGDNNHSDIAELSPDNRTGKDAVNSNKFGFTDDEFLVINGNIPEDTHHIDILLAAYPTDLQGNPVKFTFGDCEEAFIRIIDLDTKEELEKLTLETSASNSAALIFGYLTQKNGDFIWKRTAEEIEGGFRGIDTEYQIK